MSNAPSKPVSFSRPKVGYFSNRPRTKTLVSTLRLNSAAAAIQLSGYLFFFLPRRYYKHWQEPKKETQILSCRISGLCTEMLKFRHNRKPPSLVLLLWLVPRFTMGYSHISALPLCHTAGCKEKKPHFYFWNCGHEGNRQQEYTSNLHSANMEHRPCRDGSNGSNDLTCQRNRNPPPS